MRKLVKFGNMKLPKTTIIFNMASSKDCPARKKGLCRYAKICYARKPEIIYPTVLPYRERQEKFWLENSANDICSQLGDIIKRKKIKPTLFRFNESGDFHSQECIEKLNHIAIFLLLHNVVTYGYTAREDLDFENVSFLVKGSNNDSGNHGKTVVLSDIADIQTGFVECIGDCKICSLCSAEKPYNIAFVKH